ncbi:PH domain-containing protein [uncultured Ruminococcus sp.]|uniref:PH domain-containing protein n=1 Tax=uncultured Ruminococcus sp. TaxID=165186 RepID=UPI0025E7E8B2|nr:PH domain-containing protein [uncultured Ruminococcus sp.]
MTKNHTTRKKHSWLRNFFRSRQHPVKILTYIAKYLWLLVIPLAKYLIATRFDFQDWVKTNWVDILTLSVIFGYGILRWMFIYYEIEDDCIIAHTGYFGIASTRVYFSEMSSMSMCQGYIYRAIHACTVYIDTDAQSLSDSDIKLDISTRQAYRIYELATKKCANKPKYVFNSKKSNLVIFSLLFSSTLSGVLLALTFIYEVYQIFGREFEERFIERVNTEIEKLTIFIPKYLLIAALVIAGGWFLSFISNLMRHWNFTCVRCADMLLISSGKGTKRRHALKRDRINYIDYQQSMFMKLFDICTVSVQCTGYGKRRMEISALIPITTNNQAETSIKMLMPGVPAAKYDVRTGKADIGRFVTIPAVFCFVPTAVYFTAGFFIPMIPFVGDILPDWQMYLKNLALLATLPLVWLFFVKLNAAFFTAVGFDKDHCTLSYCRFYRFHRTVVNRDRISKITVTQNPFQKVSRTCTLRIYTNAETVSRHVVKGLNYKKLTKLLKRSGYPF